MAGRGREPHDRRRHPHPVDRPPQLRPPSTHLDAVVTVSEAEIAAAVRLAAEEARLVVEPSGALVVAAMRFRSAEAGLDGLDGPIVGVVSGGNVDPERYLEYLEAPIPPEG